ncbi:MAG TPA: hypothetical protein VM009_01040 [Terriglobales bacterium]|nr:hypothetical protein [Terriglobales bacterium]
MRLARALHLYFGVFFAPAIVFFAFTGFLQTYELHEGADAPRWISVLQNIHSHQRMAAPRPAPSSAPLTSAATNPAPSATPTTTAASGTTPTAGAAPSTAAAPAPARRPRPKSSVPFRIFMGFMAVGLIGSSLVGIWMGFQVNRNTPLILGLLLAGTIIPIVAFYVGVQP